jgi:hypothetical protein
MLFRGCEASPYFAELPARLIHSPTKSKIFIRIEILGRTIYLLLADYCVLCNTGSRENYQDEYNDFLGKAIVTYMELINMSADSVEFYDIKHKTKVNIPLDRVRKVVFDTKNGKRFGFRGYTDDDRKLTKFTSRDAWDALNVPEEE